MSELHVPHPRERELLAHYSAHPEYFTPLDTAEKVREIVALVGMKRGSTVLDLGCGDGRIAAILAEHCGMKVLGVDFCEERLQKAKARCAGLDCEFLLEDANDFCARIEQQYDYAILVEVLEHLERPEEILNALRPRIRRKIVGSVPIRDPYCAHLQVFDSPDDVARRLGVRPIKTDLERVFFEWSADGEEEIADEHGIPEFAIAVRGVGKCYHVYARPQDRLKQALSFGRRRYFRDFWALRNVSFDVTRGTCVGIVGPNGSGKSTLLQIIARTLRPSEGAVDVRGRVAALLELGSGFNPEFSGRENVYLNATILGLSRRQIDERFDAIAAFADIGDCLDRPVKTYSSGMVLRLAFAVQVQVEPNILIVDEALAVGDEAFQRKCFARLRAFQEQGGTILFVSHDAHAVVDLCDRAILLDRGEMLLCGRPKKVVDSYHRLLYAPAESHEAIRAEIKENSGGDEDSKKASAAKSEELAQDGLLPLTVTETPSPIAAAEELIAESDRPSFNPEMKPATTVVYDCQGAEILDPHITTIEGQRVNTLVHDEQYVYRYRVRFTQSASCVRFANGIKSLRGSVICCMAIPYGGVPYVAEGSEIDVAFRFRCSMTPDVYFLNAGVAGIVGGREIYLHRIVDALMIRVNDWPGRVAIGFVDLYTDAQHTMRREPANKAA
jgi:lipopolysaccharide transport system ATP-binding protein